ncbi:putative transmembrane domain-containing protein [Cryptosporidium canis]|uniref:Transmembrane domain-containing protein n=1 Tax=Cryptosporidium canis TaxID=195482 RepID=A0ABQ8P7V4_9CRYT|nr:putative transmembrane domain-containing protein [Cryptosporidium canis]
MEKVNYYWKALSQEVRLLERIIYKFKNQHGRLGYFRSVFRTTKELKLLCIAFQETFYNKNSVENAENYYRNLRDLKKMIRRIKWDLKDAGTSISRLLSHGFFLPMIFLLLSAFSRVYSVIINANVTIDCIIPTIPYRPAVPACRASRPTSRDIRNPSETKAGSPAPKKPQPWHPGGLDEEDEDLGEVLSCTPVSENPADLGLGPGPDLGPDLHKPSDEAPAVGEMLESESGGLPGPGSGPESESGEEDSGADVSSDSEGRATTSLEGRPAQKRTKRRRTSVHSRFIMAWHAHSVLRSKARKFNTP